VIVALHIELLPLESSPSGTVVPLYGGVAEVRRRISGRKVLGARRTGRRVAPLAAGL